MKLEDSPVQACGLELRHRQRKKVGSGKSSGHSDEGSREGRAQ